MVQKGGGQKTTKNGHFGSFWQKSMSFRRPPKVCKVEKSENGLIISCITPNHENPIQTGIENLFPKGTINKAQQYQLSFIDHTRETTKVENGIESKVPEIFKINKDQKTNFCNWLCKEGTKEDFKHFEVIFEKIQKYLLTDNE